MIRVTNKRAYAGEGLYVGRPSPLGNPWSHRPSRFIDREGFYVATREEAITRYAEMARAALDGTRPRPDWKRAFDQLVDRARAAEKDGRDLVLLCWCAPLPCHGDVLRQLVEEALNPV